MEETVVVVRVVLEFEVVLAAVDFIGGGQETLWIIVKIIKNETILGSFILMASRINVKNI